MNLPAKRPVEPMSKHPRPAPSRGAYEEPVNFEGDTIEQGTLLVSIRNTHLAAALAAVGVPLRKDKPYIQIEKKDGTRVTTWIFHPRSEDGRIDAQELLKAWRKDLDYFSEDPEHPFAYAMMAVKNLAEMQEHIAVDTPFVGFSYPTSAGRAQLLVKKGSKKHQAALRRGLKQL
jgi:hypothetical protein